MFVVDTNVLVYATDADSPAHARCRELLIEWRARASAWYTTWSILYEFLRVVTHPRVFRFPWTLADAWGFVDGVAGLARPRLAGGNRSPRCRLCRGHRDAARSCGQHFARHSHGGAHARARHPENLHPEHGLPLLPFCRTDRPVAWQSARMMASPQQGQCQDILTL